MNSNNKNFEGFSLFELLVTMGILLIITALVFPITLQKTQMARLEGYAKQLTTDIYYQQQRSSLKEIPSGIAIGSNGYTIFDGDSLSSSTETQVKQYPANIAIHSISFAFGTEILFPAGHFKPSDYGTMVITDGFNSARVSINEEGLIDYEIL